MASFILESEIVQETKEEARLKLSNEEIKRMRITFGFIFAKAYSENLKKVLLD